MATETFDEPRAPPAHATLAAIARMFHWRENSAAGCGAAALSRFTALISTASVSIGRAIENSTSGSTLLTFVALARRAAACGEIPDTTAQTRARDRPSSS